MPDTDQILADILAELRRQRQPILDLARMVGHRDLRMLQLYYNPSAEEIAQRLG